jgi:hypothetical protein
MRIGVGLAARIISRQQVSSRRQPYADADAGPRVAAVEDVMLALAAPRKAADSAQLTQGVEAVCASGQQLVRVGLVAGVPHDAIAWRIEYPMQGNGDLHRAQ